MRGINLKNLRCCPCLSFLTNRMMVPRFYCVPELIHFLPLCYTLKKIPESTLLYTEPVAQRGCRSGLANEALVQPGCPRTAVPLLGLARTKKQKTKKQLAINPFASVTVQQTPQEQSTGSP